MDVNFDFEDLLLFFFVFLIVLQQYKPRKEARRFLWSLTTMKFE